MQPKVTTFSFDPFFPWHSIEVVDINRMHTSNKNKEMMIILLNININKTVSQEVNHVDFMFSFVDIVNFMFVLHG